MKAFNRVLILTTPHPLRRSRFLAVSVFLQLRTFSNFGLIDFGHFEVGLFVDSDILRSNFLRSDFPRSDFLRGAFGFSPT